MPLNHPYAGPDWVSEYSVSPVPWVTASNITLGTIKQYDFDYVTKYIEIRNSSDTGAIAVGFTYNGVLTGSNYVLVEANETRKLDVRVKSIFLSGSVGATCDFQLLAGLTRVESRHFPGVKNIPGV